MSPGQPSEPVTRRRFLAATAAGLTAPLAARPAAAQGGADTFRPADPVTLPLDRPGIWTLHFGYQPIRIATLDVPGKGRQPVWYLVYRVHNKSDVPQRLIPLFELVTKDEPAAYLDEPQPALLAAIRKIEDPTGRLDIQSSIGISKTPVPVTREYSYPRYVYGAAIWTRVAEGSPKANVFSVYVTGLSNGLARQDTDDGREIISRKALQLDFVRPTDDRRHQFADIRPADNNGFGAEKWVYRASTIVQKGRGERGEGQDEK